MEEHFGIDIDIDLGQELRTQFLRGLKGGSGGGGSRGGSSSSVGSTYGGNRGSSYGTNGSNNGGGNGIPTWAIFSIVGVVVLVIVAVCTSKSKKSSGSATPGNDSSFDTAVSEVRRENNSSGTTATSIFETYVGDFDIKYHDRGREHTGHVKIHLKDNIVGYKIEGSCDDADGSATINEGFASYSGDAWWVEETLSGADKGLKVLTKGKFHFSTNTFEGSWQANNGVRGHYTEFKGKNVTKTFQPGGAMGENPQTLDQMLEEDIPTVDATVETPVVAATPYVGQEVPQHGLCHPTALAIPESSAPPYGY